MKFGKRLRRLREERELTQDELGKVIGVATSAIGMYEQDRRNPDFEKLIKIAKFFSVTIDSLLIDDNDTFGQRLRALRDEHDLTQTEFGKAVGLEKTTVSNYETDYSQPNFETLIKIADYFDVTTDYLLGRTPSQKTTKRQVAGREGGIE